MSTARRDLAVVVAAWVVTRVPMLGPGLGSDLDGWRLVHSATTLLSNGAYVPSRPPGYPVAVALHALAGALGGGAALAHLLVAALASLALGLLTLRLARSPLVALAVLLHPLVVVHSTSAMDYVPATALVVAAAVAARARPVLAGVLGGLGSACRPAVVPGIVLCRSRASFVAWLAVAAVAWLPAAAALGRGALRAAAPVSIEPAVVAYQVGQQVTGVAGALVLGAALVLGRADRAGRAAGWGRHAATAAALAVPWVLLPLDPAYLVPALPFALVALAGLLRRAWFAAVVLAVVSNGVVSLAVVDRDAYREEGRLAVAPVAAGLVVREARERRAMTDALAELADADLPARAVVLVDLPPVGLAALRPERWRAAGFERAVDRDGRLVVLDPAAVDVRGWIEEGRPVSWLPGRGIRHRLRRVEGYDPAELGAVPLAR